MKKITLSTLLISTLVLSNVAYAEVTAAASETEGSPVVIALVSDLTTPIQAEPTNPSTPVPPTEPSTYPSDPDTIPDTPNTPPSDPDTTPDTPNTPPSDPSTTPEAPNTPPSDPDTTPDTPNTPPSDPGTTPDTPNTPPSDPGTTPDTPNTPPSDPGTTPDTPNTPDNGSGDSDTKPKEDDKQVAAPAPFQPIHTQYGHKIVGVDNGGVVVQNEDGQTEIVAPEAVGGQTNSDGSISVVSATGKMEILPRTGEKENTSLVGLGLVLLTGLGLYLVKQRKEDSSNL